jgi:aspartate aminotransferase
MLILPGSSLDIMLGKVALAEKAGRKIVKMLAGEPDFNTPPLVVEAAKKALDNGKTRYVPASGISELKEAIVRNFAKRDVKSDVSNILISPGARFCIFAAVASVCEEGDEVIIPTPYWNGYNGLVAATGAKLVAVPLTELECALTPRTKVIIINSPSNPSGEIYDKKTLAWIAELAAKRGIYVISDEIYGELVYGGEKHVSIASLPQADKERVIIADGFSKTFAMTGWRLGYMHAPTAIAKKAAALQLHITHSPTSFAQYGALEALSGRSDDYVENMRKSLERRRDMLCDGLSEIKGLKFEKPKGAFYVMLDVSGLGLSGEEFADRLLEQQDLAVIPCGDFGAPYAVRLSYAISDENLRESLARLKLFAQANARPS